MVIFESALESGKYNSLFLASSFVDRALYKRVQPRTVLASVGRHTHYAVVKCIVYISPILLRTVRTLKYLYTLQD